MTLVRVAKERIEAEVSRGVIVITEVNVMIVVVVVVYLLQSVYTSDLQSCTISDEEFTLIGNGARQKQILSANLHHKVSLMTQALSLSL